MIISGIQVHWPTCLHQYHGPRWWHQVFIILGPYDDISAIGWHDGIGRSSPSAHMITSSIELHWPCLGYPLDANI
jgi:hypothetical protein